MKTLTVEEAQAELPYLLAAVSQGTQVMIPTGDDLIALHSVQQGATDYAKKEYGLTDEDIQRYLKACDERYERLEAEGKLIVMTEEDNEKKPEEVANH